MPLGAADHGQSRRPLVLLTLGVRQFAILGVSIGLVLVIAGVLVYPTLHVRYIQEIGIERFELQYGFRAGPVAVGSHTSRTDSAWGVVWVAPGGLFAQLGVRAGDIPFEYHGGVADMYAALEQATSGEPSSFQVYNSSDAQLGAKALRLIKLPPVKK